MKKRMFDQDSEESGNGWFLKQSARRRNGCVTNQLKRLSIFEESFTITSNACKYCTNLSNACKAHFDNLNNLLSRILNLSELNQGIIVICQLQCN